MSGTGARQVLIFDWRGVEIGSPLRSPGKERAAPAATHCIVYHAGAAPFRNRLGATARYRQISTGTSRWAAVVQVVVLRQSGMYRYRLYPQMSCDYLAKTSARVQQFARWLRSKTSPRLQSLLQVPAPAGEWAGGAHFRDESPPHTIVQLNQFLDPSRGCGAMTLRQKLEKPRDMLHQ